jgi:hypothetical protein
MKLESLNIVLYKAIFLLPGFFIRNIISSLNPTRKSSDNITFLSCFMYSVINLAIWSWAYIWVTNKYINQYISDSFYFIILLLISLIGGFLLSFFIGVIIQKRCINKIAQKFNIRSVDPTDSCWDWLFSNLVNRQIVITLKDNSQICGWFGGYSFSSSDPNERDIFIEYTYKKRCKW